MDPKELQKELLRTLDDIKVQAEQIRTAASSMGVDPVALRDTNGSWVLAPLLGARAQVLHALAILETEGDLGNGTERKEGSNGSD